MATVLRTTGGLLQLKKKRVTQRDYSGIVEFARTIRDDGVRSRIEQHTRSPIVQQQRVITPSSSAAKPEPVDLQAIVPEVFR